MPISESEKAFVSHVVDMMQVVGPVNHKRMFGGHGIFLDGLMFALIADSTLYLKVDSQNKDEFVELGLEPFTYYKQGKPFHLSYFQAPEETLEDIDSMREWANSAYSASLRANAKKPKKIRTKKSPSSD